MSAPAGGLAQHAERTPQYPRRHEENDKSRGSGAQNIIRLHNSSFEGFSPKAKHKKKKVERLPGFREDLCYVS